MNPVYSEDKKILADDVNMFRELRTSTFFRWLQEISIAHTEKLKQGRDKTLDKGALWILARVKIKFNRVPSYDEEIEFSTWPSDTLHVLFPRNYLLKDGGGQTLATASATWLLMDAKTRKMAFPKLFGVVVKGVKIGGELPISAGISSENVTNIIKRKVTFRDVDINTHLNSARYLDYLDDILGEKFLAAKSLSDMEIDYVDEARIDEILTIGYKIVGGNVYMEGSVKARPCFRLKAVYTDKR